MASTIMNLVPLNTPPQDPASTRFSEWSMEELNAWLGALPRNDATVFGNTLHCALLGLNRTRLQQLPRYEAMERLRPVVNDACAMLLSRYRNSSLPLTVQEQAHADRVRQLYAALATGFKIAVNDEISRHLQRKSPDLVPLQLATQRALLCLGRVLLECYRVYAPEPPLLWHDLHTLYRNSERARLQTQPLYSAPDSDETALSIKQAYLRITVLALSNPYHLLQGEADELYRRIGRWVHFVQLRTATTDRIAGGFAVDLDSDLPARYFSSSTPTPAQGDLRILDLQQFVDTVARQADNASALLAACRSGGTLSMRMQRDMYTRFRSALHGRDERGSERKPTLARLVLAQGFAASHFFLSGCASLVAEQDQIGEPLPACFKSKSDNPAAPPPQMATQWNRKNESAGGLALFCAKDSPVQARVGDLVAYAASETAATDAWRIGAIRWLRTRPHGGLELGVQCFAENGHAVAVQAIGGSGKGSEQQRAILIPRINPATDAATLLVPASNYDVDSILQLRMDDRAVHLRLTEQLEITHLFAHFRFELVKNLGG